MVIYTIGYGGRHPDGFLDLLSQNGVLAVIDVRQEPQKSSMGCYRFARSADKGIQGLLARRGITYFSFRQLGNEFRHDADWRERFREKMTQTGDQMVEPLFSPGIPRPFCLMCSEKRVAECHRGLIAEFLQEKGCKIRHIE